MKKQLVVPLLHVKFGEDGTVVELVHKVLNNRSLGYPVSLHELVGYPEVHAGPNHVWFQVFLIYAAELWLWLNY